MKSWQKESVREPSLEESLLLGTQPIPYLNNHMVILPMKKMCMKLQFKLIQNIKSLLSRKLWPLL